MRKVPKTFEEWRIAYDAKRDGQTLSEVGPDKPMGYLGMAYSAARECCEYLAEHRVGVEILTFPDERLKGVCWVHAFHTVTLQAMLDANREMLLISGWPIVARPFVERCHVETVPRGPLFDFIADCYGDVTNPGRSEFQDVSWRAAARRYLTLTPDEWVVEQATFLNPAIAEA